MSDSIKVYARVRPLNASEKAASTTDNCVEVTKDGRSIIINAPTPTLSQSQAAGYGSAMRSAPRAGWTPASPAAGFASPMSPNAATQHTFHFDCIYDPTATQHLLYQQAVAPLLDSLMDGYNSTILAYGQTGSGKTFTMLGNSKITDEITPDSTHGVIPRMIHGIFDHIDASDETIEFTIKIAVFEIYMEKIRDLLSGQDGLRIRDDSQSVWVEDLTQVYVTSIQELFAVIEAGQSSRSTSSTNMNDVSSRSHLLVQITIGQHFSQTGEKRGSVLTLVDLAGSEKVAKTNAEGQTLKEAQHINKSLSALGNVINSCSAKLPHVPYRDSKLTHVLRDSIAGNSKTSLIITCSPSGIQHDETLSTCRFGQRAATIQNKPIMNRERSVEEYKTLFLNSFRLVVRRTNLLGTAVHTAIGYCATQHDSGDLNNITAHGGGGFEDDDELDEETSMKQTYAILSHDLNPSVHFSQLLTAQDPKAVQPAGSGTQITYWIQPAIIQALKEICDPVKDADILGFLQGQLINPLSGEVISKDGFNLQRGATSSYHSAASPEFSGSNQGLLSPMHLPASSGQQLPALLLSAAPPLDAHAQSPVEQTPEQLVQAAIEEGLQAKCQVLQDRNTKMIQYMKELETTHGLKLLQLTNDVESKEQECIHLKTEITDSYIQQQHLHDQISSLQQDILIQQQQKEKSLETVDSLNAQLEKFTTLLKQKDNTIKSLCDENSSRQEEQLKYESQLIQRVEKSRHILEQKEMTIKKLTDNYTNSSSQLETAQTQIKTLEKQYDELLTRYDGIKDEYVEQLNELKGKLEEYISSKEELRAKESQLSILHEQISLLKSTNVTLNETISTLRESSSKQETALRELRLQYEQLSSSVNPTKQEKSLIQDLQAQNIELQKTLTAVQHELQSSKNLVLDVGEKYRSLTADHNKLIIDYKTVQSRLRDTDLQLSDRSSRLTKYENDVIATRKQYEALLSQHHTLEQEYERAKDKAQLQQTSYTSLEQQLLTTQAYSNTLSSEIKLLTEKLTNINSDTNDLLLKEKELAESIQDEYKTLQGLLNNKETEYMNLQQKFIQLKKEKDDLVSQYTTSQQQAQLLEDALIETQDELKKAKEKYGQLDSQYTTLQKKHSKLEENSQERFFQLEKEKSSVQFKYDKLCKDFDKLNHTNNDNALLLSQHSSTISELSTKNDQLTGKYQILSLRYDNYLQDSTTQIDELSTIKEEYTKYKDSTSKELNSLTNDNIKLKQDVLDYKQRFGLLESNLSLLKNKDESLITDLRRQLEQIREENNQLKNSIVEMKESSSKEQTDSNGKYHELRAAYTDLQTAHSLLTQEHNELSSKSTEEKSLLQKQLHTLQNDVTQQEKLNKVWQSQHEVLLNEKSSIYEDRIVKLDNEVSELNTTIASLKMECESLKHQTNLALSEQNKVYSQDLLILRTQHHAELKVSSQEKNQLLTQITDLSQTVLQLQDLNTLQQQEISTYENRLKRNEEKRVQLQIQWEQNIEQQMGFDSLMQGKIDELEKILTNHGILFSVGNDGQYLVESNSGSNQEQDDDDKGKKEKRGLFSKSSNEKKDAAFVAQQLRGEVKTLQTELDEKKALVEKKEKQYQRLNNNFLEKCKSYDALQKECHNLKEKLEDAKYDIDDLERLFEDPEEISKLRKDYQDAQDKLQSLQEANKLLLLNDYDRRKKVGTHIGGGGHHPSTPGNKTNNSFNTMIDDSTIPTTSHEVDSFVTGSQAGRAQRKNALVSSPSPTAIQDGSQDEDRDTVTALSPTMETDELQMTSRVVGSVRTASVPGYGNMMSKYF